MAKIKVHAGDFLTGDSEGYSFGSLRLRTEKNSFFGESISLRELETVDIATEENVKKIGEQLVGELQVLLFLAQ